MPKNCGAAAIVLAGVLCAACGGRTKSGQQARPDGAVGTSGRPASGAVTIRTEGEPPVFVTRNREGDRLWSLTKQFYQKRGNAPAWMNQKPGTMCVIHGPFHHIRRPMMHPKPVNINKSRR